MCLTVCLRLFCQTLHSKTWQEPRYVRNAQRCLSFFFLNWTKNWMRQEDELCRSSKDRKCLGPAARIHGCNFPFVGPPKHPQCGQRLPWHGFLPVMVNVSQPTWVMQWDCQYLHMGHHRFIIWPIAHPCYTGSMCFLAERNQVMCLFILLAAEVNKQARPKASSRFPWPLLF